METTKVEVQPVERDVPTPVAPNPTTTTTQVEAKTTPAEPKPKTTKSACKAAKCKKSDIQQTKALKQPFKEEKKRKNKKKKQSRKHHRDESSESDSTDSDSDSESDLDTESESGTSISDSSSDESSESEEESEDERRHRRHKQKKSKRRAHDRRTKKKLRRRAKRRNTPVSDDESQEDSDVSVVPEESTDPEDNSGSEMDDGDRAALSKLTRKLRNHLDSVPLVSSSRPPPPGSASTRHRSLMKATNTLVDIDNILQRPKGERTRERRSKRSSRGKRGSKLDFKRVDQLWDREIHNYKLRDTVEDAESSEYDQYVFNVRRKFNWDGKYTHTIVDIKSPLIREALSEIMEGVKGVSLAGENPTVDPNMIFLYLEDLRESMKKLKAKLNSGEKMKRKERKRSKTKIQHVKILMKYLDEDYAELKKTLYPMLESGQITFELLWTLYKPNTIVYTNTYGCTDQPRAFKVEYAEKDQSFVRGEWYNVEGRYLEYDGKTWGMGSIDAEVPSFKGSRKITSLQCYPLKYHKEEEKIRAELIERGKKFVALQGVHFRAHEGLAFQKRKQVIKVNINGRIMVDPATFRRLMPNYPISNIKPNEDDDDECCSCASDDEEEDDTIQDCEDEDLEPRTKTKVVHDEENDRLVVVEVPVDEDGNEIVQEKLEVIDNANADDDLEGKEKEIPVFTDEEYLVASPVVLGFSFGEKLWLEFTVSGIKEIVWNSAAYQSLVIEPQTKDIVKALVQSHKYHGTKSIDDVIQGKGKGLVAVLHGPPGTGKTLTAEGIGELLKCPVYMVSAGELGTDPRTLEQELQRILDVAHAWGAVLLLDEADVFLEKRSIHDIHRNALVSIFLRLLEYFQGILFLTTNRVETFDDAFQSRIHIALRYGDLTPKAKKSVFKQFIDRVRIQEGLEHMPFKEDDYNTLARHNLNGRQIKNTVRTAQALALSKGEGLSMEHIKSVLDVHMSFERDLKGGPGFEDAMKSYF